MSMKPVLALIAVEVAQDLEDHDVAEVDEVAVAVAVVDEVAVDKSEGDAFSKRHSGI